MNTYLVWTPEGDFSGDNFAKAVGDPRFPERVQALTPKAAVLAAAAKWEDCEWGQQVYLLVLPYDRAIALLHQYQQAEKEAEHFMLDLIWDASRIHEDQRIFPKETK